MRIADMVRIEQTTLDLAAMRPVAKRANNSAAVSREERLHLLAGKVPATSVAKSAGTYSERAQLLSNSTTTRHSWVV